MNIVCQVVNFESEIGSQNWVTLVTYGRDTPVVLLLILHECLERQAGVNVKYIATRDGRT